MSTAPPITCPKCAKKFKGKGDLTGKKIKCPFCQEPFTVGQDAVKAGEPPVLMMAKEEEDDPKAGYGVTAMDLTPRCPNCANEMESKDAIICLFCGYNTLTRTWGKTEKVRAISAGKHFLHLLPGIMAVLAIIAFVSGLLFYATIMPYFVVGTWMSFLDHESLRMWSVFIVLIFAWGIGVYAYKRLITEPMPLEESLD